jgi:hypothetical protein
VRGDGGLLRSPFRHFLATLPSDRADASRLPGETLAHLSHRSRFDSPVLPGPARDNPLTVPSSGGHLFPRIQLIQPEQVDAVRVSVHSTCEQGVTRKDRFHVPEAVSALWDGAS